MFVNLWQRMVKQPSRRVQHGRNAGRRRKPAFQPRLEILERRTLPSTVNWIGGSGDWNDATHWLDAMTPPLQQHINRLVHAVTANVGFASANDATSAIQLPESASFTISQDEQDEDKFSDEFEVPPLSDGDPSTGAMDSDEFELVLDDDTDLGRELVALDDDDDEFELELSSE